MHIVNTIVKEYLRQRISRIGKAWEHPELTQRKVLSELVRTARHTEWGKKYGFSGIKTPADFAARVPVHSYEEIKPYIIRTYNGEQNVLWPTPIRWFSKSSGTTDDRSKFLPVSPESLQVCHYRAGKDLLALYVNQHPDTTIFSGKSLVLTGSVMPNSLNQHAFAGDVSGVLIHNLPKWANWFRTPDKSIALLPNWEDKIVKMLPEITRTNVTTLSGVPSWMLVLCNSVLDYTRSTDLREVWPQLTLFMHGAVNFEPYRAQFKRIIPHPDMHYYETYNASEGFFAMQRNDQPGEMTLMLDYGIYYEFIPWDEMGSATAQAVPLWEVEVGKNYAMLISTNAGLWRYLIGDTVRFTSTQPYAIQITGRTKHYINAFGEELMVDNAERALAFASAQTNAAVSDYTVAPVYLEGKEAGTHEWLIEFEKVPDDAERFVDSLDQKLMELNSDYEAKRKGNLTLRRPLVRLLPARTFYNWMKKRGKLGGQHKVPRLSNDRRYVDDIMSDLGVNMQG